MQFLRTTNPWRLLGAILLATAIIILAINGQQWFPQLKQLVTDNGSTGFLLFMLIFIVLTSLCFPVSVLGFTAGALYGPWIGLLLIFPSGLVSGTLMFFLGRGLLRGFVQNFIQKNKRMRAIENIASEKAIRLNVMVRLSPFNFGLASYALAVGKSRLPAYLVGVLAILPSLTAQVWVGALAGKAGSPGEVGGEGNRLELILLAVGVLFFLILTLQIGKMIRQAMAADEKD